MSRPALPEGLARDVILRVRVRSTGARQFDAAVAKARTTRAVALREAINMWITAQEAK